MSWHHLIHLSCLRRRSALSLLGKRPSCEKCGPTSDVSYRYPELHGLYIGRLRSALSSSKSKAVFQKQLSRYFSGELPHGGAILTALLQALMNGTIVNDPRCGLSNNCNTIPRVSRPWPVRTVRNDCPVYAFFFVFPIVSLFNPHSFITTSYVLIYSYFSSLTACLYVRYSAR